MGSIEASIPSGLCSGSLGGCGEDTSGAGGEAEPDEHQQLTSHQAATLVGLRLADLQSPGDEDEAHQQQQQHIGNGSVAAAAAQLVGEFGTSFWVDDMAGFPLPPLDLDPLPPGLFSPCSGTYKFVAPFFLTLFPYIILIVLIHYITLHYITLHYITVH